MAQLTREQADALAVAFFPEAFRRIKEMRRTGGKFVYYTSAPTAVDVLRNKEMWMRTTMAMNDYDEVEHGSRLMLSCLADHGQDFVSALNACHNGLGAAVIEQYRNWLPGMKRDTFITCVSEHLPSEDQHGRLSMWRAYADNTNGVALVLNGAALLSEAGAIACDVSPVEYYTPEQFTAHFLKVVQNIKDNRELLASVPDMDVFARAFHALRAGTLCTKHPGFHEEREWRIFTSPIMGGTEGLKTDVKVVRGTPQLIMKIPLVDMPDKDFHDLAIPNLIDKLIIGPTELPDVMYRAFATLLEQHGITDHAGRIKVSGIPLRNF